MNFPEVLRRIVAALESCGIPYMITGSFAAQAGADSSDLNISPE
jgi:hypothetical protein